MGDIFYAATLDKVTEWPGSPGRPDHAGTDFAVPVGTPVPAAFDGVVRYVGDDGLGGMTVDIVRSDGLLCRYGHNSNYLVSVGQRVTALQTVALSGNTGRSTGPHIHQEFRWDTAWNGGRWVDPRTLGAIEPGSTSTKSKGEDMFVNINGKAGDRRSGCYLLKEGRAYRLSAKWQPGVPSFEDDAAINELRKHYAGLA